MATHQLFVTNVAAASPNWFSVLQDGGTVPTAVNSSYGWTVGKIATGYWNARLGASALTTTAMTSASSFISGASGPVKGTGATNATAGDSFIAGPFTGTFAAGNWVFTAYLRSTTNGATGHLNLRIWRSANADGSSATQVFAFTACSSISPNSAADINGGLTFNPGAITLNNEYLFFQLEWQETSAGSSNSCNILFHVGLGTAGPSYSSFVTPDLGPSSISGTLALTQAAQTISATGDVPVIIVGNLALTEQSDTLNATGDVPVIITGTLALTEASDTISAAGKVLVGGTLALTEAADTISATGAPAAIGTLGLTEASDTINAAGKVLVGGTLGLTEASDTISATGLAAAIGTLALTEVSDTLAAGGTVTGGAAPWTPAALGTDLLAWFDANDAATITVTGSGVSQWLDKSGYSRHIIQPNDPNRPAYSAGRVGLIDSTSLYPLATQFPTGNHDYIFAGKSIGAAKYHTLLLSGGAQHINFIIDTSENCGVWVSSFFQVGGLSWAPGTDALLYGSISNTSATAMAKNGGALTTASVGTFDCTLFSLGQSAYPQGFGDLYEFVMVPYLATTDTRQKLEGYLAWKWSLAGLLPSDHPYKAAPPSSGGPISITGTLALTQADQTVSAQGKVLVGGTLAVTEDPDTISGAGKVLVGGTLSITEAADTISAAGSVLVSGTLSATEAPDTISAAGKVLVGGTLSISEDPDTILAAGTVSGGVASPPYFNSAKTGPSITLQNNNLTAIRLSSSGTYDNTYTTTTSGASKVYAEIRSDTLIDVGRNALGVGLDTGPILASWIGDTASAFGWYGDGTVYNNGANISPAPTYAAGHWLGIALDRLGQTVQFKNITTSSAWSAAINVASFGAGDVAVRATLQSQNQSYTVNFVGTFLGAPPASGYARWDGTAIDASAAVAQARVVVMA
jgi:hypothetical protein